VRLTFSLTFLLLLISRGKLRANALDDEFTLTLNQKNILDAVRNSHFSLPFLEFDVISSNSLFYCICLFLSSSKEWSQA